MRNQLTNLLFGLLMLCALNSCNDCNNGVHLIPGFWGNWKLTKVVSPSKIMSNLSYKEYLKIGLATGPSRTAVTKEWLRRDSLLRDTVLVSADFWDVYSADCKNASVTVTYSNHLQRKYWLSNQEKLLEGTGYVSQIGDKSDTVRYYYQKQ